MAVLIQTNKGAHKQTLSMWNHYDWHSGIVLLQVFLARDLVIASSARKRLASSCYVLHDRLKRVHIPSNISLPSHTLFSLFTVHSALLFHDCDALKCELILP